MRARIGISALRSPPKGKMLDIIENAKSRISHVYDLGPKFVSRREELLTYNNPDVNVGIITHFSKKFTSFVRGLPEIHATKRSTWYSAKREEMRQKLEEKDNKKVAKRNK